MGVATAPFKAAGTTIGYKLLSSDTSYLPFALITSLDPGGVEIEEIDTTTLASLVMSSIPSIPDNGEITLKTFYVPGNAAITQLETLAATPAVIFWQIQFPNGTSSTTGTCLQLTAWLKSLKRNTLEVKTSPMADVTLRVTGPITIVPAT